MAGDSLQPILRWAGGKSKLLRRLLGYVPGDYRDRTYREPFLGAASMYFALQPSRSILSDSNPHLISCFEHIRDNWQSVHRYLRGHGTRVCETYYYEIREKYNESESSAAQAARFIFLNKTCFNGIFRVNAKGQFNVPYGWKDPPAIPSRKLLQAASEVLCRASIRRMSYETALLRARPGDFIYLDPPYPPLNGTAYFTHYTMDRFSIHDQKKLAECVSELDKRGCLLLMSNADTPLIRRLYRKYTCVTLPVTRYLTCKSVRHTVNELIIMNYEVKDAK